ncbi:unnamed protein product [Caenorhabditis brenneri]
MNSIPFLRLPFLVIQNMLSMMCPLELINLAKVSKRTKRVVKAIVDTQLSKKYHVDVYISENYGTAIKNGKNSWYYMYTSRRIPTNYLLTEQTVLGSTIVFLQNFTLNKLDDFQRICDLCHDLFGDFKGIDIDMDNTDNQSIIDFLRTKQESFEDCEVCSISARGDDVKHFLENLEITQNLSISAQIPEDLEINLPESVENSIFIQHSKFIKLEQFLALKSKQISLNSTKFTNQDIRSILKSWMASESHLNLERLRIAFNSTTNEYILQNIPIEDGNEFQMDVRFVELKFAPRGPDIRREDGKKARVILWRQANRSILDMYIH